MGNNLVELPCVTGCINIRAARLVYLLLPFVAFASWGIRAQDYGTWDRGVETPNSAAAITPLDATSFGDKISLYSGTVEFSNVDVAIPGNQALPVEFRRSFRIEDRRESASGSAPLGVGYLGGVGEWDVDVPYLKGTFLGGDRWISDSSDQRCSLTFAPRDYPSFSADEYWHGNVMHIPGVLDETMLQAVDNAIPEPTDGLSYPWITKSLWRFRCKSATANGYPGEGFIAVSPNGVKYHFDWVVTRGAPAIRLGNMRRERNNVYFLATLVEDRFGNWVRYGYAADKLTSITSSDGRSINIAYSNFNVSTVTSSLGTWTYTYAPNNRLERVTQPDGSTWEYSAVGRLFVEPPPPDDYEPTPNCSHNAHSLRGYGSFRYYVTSPSGANAEYAFTVNRLGRNNVPRRCNPVPGTQDPQLDTYLEIPTHLQNFTLRSKKISGPGLVPGEWSYSYGSRQGRYQSECEATPCPAAANVEIRGPDGKLETYIFGILFRVNDGQLLGVQVGTESLPTMSSKVFSYVQSGEVSTYPFPDRVGGNLLLNSDSVALAGLRPLKTSTLTQQGTAFTWQANSFDQFGNPLSVTRSSAPGGYSRTDVATYHHNLTKWVIGQTASSTNSNTGLVESLTTYDANAMPWKVYAFGQLQQTLTYDTASSVASGQRGTLKTSTDGNGNTTAYADWRRGLPQQVTYADGKVKSAVVSNLGTIASVTDENLYNTFYDYDAMGRLATIDYPNGDAVDWNNTTLAFVQVNSAEYGLPAGHWRQTVRTGNGQKVTYFDALWRPRLVREFDSGDVAGTIRSQLYCYDSEGRQTYASYAKGDVSSVSCALTGTRTAYDAIGRVQTVEQDSELGVLTTTTEYLNNSDGPYTRVTNPRGFQTRTWYQAFDAPSQDAPVAIWHPEGAYTDLVRDVFGKPKSITRRNSTASVALARQYVYDEYQRLCKTIEPEAGSTVLHYDAAGNLDWSAAGLSYASPALCNHDSVPASAKVARSYDARNRLQTLSFPDGRGDQTWTYTPDGLPSTIVTHNGGGDTVTQTYGYTRRRLPASERLQAGTTDWTVGYAYNANGHLYSHSLPLGAPTALYSPNALGQPTRVGDYATNVRYHPNGAMAQFSYGNGLIHTLSQNARGLPDRSQDTYNANARLDDSYDYDANGNVAAISDALADHRGDRTMAYDGLDRLTDVVSPMYGATGAHYWYDEVDNLTRVHIGGTGFRNHYYCYDTQWRLTNVKADSCAGTTVTGLGYDVRGNVDNQNGTTYDFDLGNRLRGSSAGASVYTYDGYGRRVKDAVNGIAKISLYSQAGQLLLAKDERQQKESQYYYLNGSLVAIREKALPGGTVSIKYQHTDALGTPVAVTDEARTVIERSEYEPYGKLLNRPLADGPGFTGHVADAATGLDYMQQRYYWVGGRFMSVDPVTATSIGGNFNRYWYANNNPYRFTDPDGRQSVGEMIDSGAEGCGPVTCAGWATLNATWKVLGAEGVSQVADKGWSNTTGGDKVSVGLEVLAVLPPVKLLKGATVIAKESAAAMGFSRPQLQHAFKHASDFGILGNANNSALTAFKDALQGHVDDIATVAIRGTYRGAEVTHFLNPSSGLNVMKDASGNFLSGWKLSPQQLEHVMRDGKLGGGK